MFSPIIQRLSAAGFSPWVPVNWEQQAFNIGFAVILSSNADLTYNVEHTFDPLHKVYPSGSQFAIPSVSRVTTTATLKLTNHGLSVADWIGTDQFGGVFDGNFSVASVTDQNNVTYTVANSGITAGGSLGTLRLARVRIHAVANQLTASYDGNYISPPFAIRLNITSYTAGYADLIIMQGRG